MREEEEFLKHVDYMRGKGYAVVVFSPEALGNAPVDRVEDVMAEAGEDSIDELGDLTPNKRGKHS